MGGQTLVVIKHGKYFFNRALDRRGCHLNEWEVHCTQERNRKALVMTDAELKLIARAAIKGESNQPVNG